ncbi:MAG: serine/threonine-protein kinase, partial [Thermoanaerobaculia bacterium]
MRRPDPARFALARARFEELAEMPQAARAESLAALTESDPELAAELAELLAADLAAGEEFLDRGVGGYAPELVGEALDAGLAANPEAGQRIGPWKLRALLGRGGMGEVWEAERADGQFDQVVALKLLKRGMDSEEVLRRFLRERQILARLEHPNIARLLDGGIAADGRPYFALERVEGKALGDWCRARRASLRTRVELLIAVADAVAVAHRSLIVHRDLKPSNILVDGDGRVKLLDFGIAKLLSGDEGEAGERTRLEARALTPAYAAPEQILGEPVTTATDVYALGVVLYELMTDRLPHDRSATSAAALADKVERETLTRPSQAAATAGEARKSRLLAGDLDTIVLKALARDPLRRYESATALAEDLRRHLDGRPVLARPDSRLYRSRKFIARHKVGVMASALALLSLSAGLSAALWQARRAAASALRAEANAARAERVKEFLVASFDIASPEFGIGGTTTASDLIEQAGRQIDAAGFGRDP